MANQNPERTKNPPIPPTRTSPASFPPPGSEALPAYSPEALSASVSKTAPASRANAVYPADSERLKASYRECERIMKSRAVSFYQAFRLLPTEIFQSIQAIYAFCRYVDDVTDRAQDPGDARRELSRMEELLRALFSGRNFEPNDAWGLDAPWLPAFADTARKYNFALHAFLSQIEGQRRDLEMRDMESMEELLLYCENVAGSVGLMLMPILALPGAQSEKLERACLNLGIGMQLTNILRDVGEDITQRDRMYLPAELMRRHGLTRETLTLLADKTKKSRVPEEFKALWEEIAAYSAPRYESIFEVIGDFREEARLPLLSAALLYRGIEDAVRESGYNCLTKRCYTSAMERGKRILAAKRLLRGHEKGHITKGVGYE